MYTLHSRTLERAEVFGNTWAPQLRMIRVIRLNMKKFQILDKKVLGWHVAPYKAQVNLFYYLRQKEN